MLSISCARLSIEIKSMDEYAEWVNILSIRGISNSRFLA